MSYNYLDKTGLGQVWGKVKALIPTKTSDLQNDSGYVTSNTTYTLSISGNVITLTGSEGNPSSVTLPVYNGGVTTP